VLGAITLATAESRRAYSERDLGLVEELARRAALSLERARLFTAEQEARAEAERASLAKSQFLAVMSHELRTPLNAILGYADLLDAEISGPLSDQQHQHLQRVQSSARHLRELIDQVLSLARIEAGREELYVEPVDLVELAQEAISLVEPLAQRLGLALRFTGSPALLPVETDAGKVRQIFLNLLGNAIKFTEVGAVEVDLGPDNEGVVCRVRDTGVGIAPGDQERIFEPFTQVDGSSTRRAGGTGLGLPVSRQLARLLGGELTVQSRPGEGSTFTLHLPISSSFGTGV
jgi:signal transduction histidine kinase